MPQLLQFFRTTVVNGIASAESDLIVVALYAPGEPIDLSDGAELRIRDSDGDGLISRQEWRDATGGGGFGLNGGSNDLLFDGDRGGNNGTLYHPSPVLAGTDLSGFLDDLTQDFAPIDPEGPATEDPTQTPNDNPICFTAGTLIATPGGAAAVETLAPGDPVLTRDHGAQPVRWVGLRRYRATELAARPELRPVRIAAGALGQGMPARDLVVSPQHRILVANRIAARMFGVPEVLVAAKKLTGLPGVAVEPAGRGVTYVHIAFDAHQIVTANGAAAESLLPGPVALGALDAASQAELAEIFPGLGVEAPVPARPVPRGRRVVRMVERQRRNACPAVE